MPQYYTYLNGAVSKEEIHSFYKRRHYTVTQGFASRTGNVQYSPNSRSSVQYKYSLDRSLRVQYCINFWEKIHVGHSISHR